MLLTSSHYSFDFYTCLLEKVLFHGYRCPPLTFDTPASKEAKNEAEESGLDVLPLKPRVDEASSQVVGSSIHQPLNSWLHHKSLLACPLTHHGFSHMLSHYSHLWRDFRYKFYISKWFKMHQNALFEYLFNIASVYYILKHLISHRLFQGARMSVSSASGKHSPAAATKNATAMGPLMWPRSHAPRIEMWMRLKANILLPTSRLLAATKQPMVGPQPIFPGNPKTAESILSRLAKLSPALKHEMPMETAMLTKSALANLMDAMLWMPTMKDIKKLLCTNAEIADSATFKENMRVYADDIFQNALPGHAALIFHLRPFHWILHVSNICQSLPAVFSYSFHISAR